MKTILLLSVRFTKKMTQKNMAANMIFSRLSSYASFQMSIQLKGNMLFSQYEMMLSCHVQSRDHDAHHVIKEYLSSNLYIVLVPRL